jgi:hypothetical protein
MSGRWVSVGVAEGVTGNGVIVNVGVTVKVSLGTGVTDGGGEIGMTCVVAGAQAVSKKSITKTNENNFFIVYFYGLQPLASLTAESRMLTANIYKTLFHFSFPNILHRPFSSAVGQDGTCPRPGRVAKLP